MTITIYHNPDCGTSRNTLAMIRQSGEEPVVIEYLKTPPSRGKLVELIAAMGIGVYGLSAALVAASACFVIRMVGVHFNLNAPEPPGSRDQRR